ncbi:EthD domain-containing protein [Candidatus Poriferisodalis sp.]|uniref:EthD domain-containing protein n=1 Tax=Candidatus Poriferisodalis sp. TaxID=3101277 RepID=UPI003B028169
MTSDITATAGAKMIYLIRRRPEATRDELVANWFKNHMPGVIAGQERAAAEGRVHATKYLATLFDQRPGRDVPWDGMAQLWFDRAVPNPPEPHGTVPADTFQQKAEPYVGWATTEYVVVDGELPVAPNTLNEPFPTTRSGLFKVTFLVPARAGADHDAAFRHWLEVHVPNVRSVMGEIGGLRYVVSHSQRPAAEAYLGMAELYFRAAAGWDDYRATITEDGFSEYVDLDRLVNLQSTTQMIGIPG